MPRDEFSWFFDDILGYSEGQDYKVCIEEWVILKYLKMIDVEVKYIKHKMISSIRMDEDSGSCTINNLYKAIFLVDDVYDKISSAECMISSKESDAMSPERKKQVDEIIEYYTKHENNLG